MSPPGWQGRRGGGVDASAGGQTCPAARREVRSRVSGKDPKTKKKDLFIEVEGARRVQMRCGFRPRDRDRTTEGMERVWMGFGPLSWGVGLQTKEALRLPG